MIHSALATKSGYTLIEVQQGLVRFRSVSVTHVVEQKNNLLQLPCQYIFARSAPQTISCSTDLYILTARESSCWHNAMAQQGGFTSNMWMGELGQFLALNSLAEWKNWPSIIHLGFTCTLAPFPGDGLHPADPPTQRGISPLIPAEQTSEWPSPLCYAEQTQPTPLYWTACPFPSDCHPIRSDGRMGNPIRLFLMA